MVPSCGIVQLHPGILVIAALETMAIANLYKTLVANRTC